jgi:hypothetical protein
MAIEIKQLMIDSADPKFLDRLAVHLRRHHGLPVQKNQLSEEERLEERKRAQEFLLTNFHKANVKNLALPSTTSRSYAEPKSFEVQRSYPIIFLLLRAVRWLGRHSTQPSNLNS